MTLSAIVGSPSLTLASQLIAAASHYQSIKGDTPFSILASHNSYNQLVTAAKEYRPDLVIIDEQIVDAKVLPLLRAFAADLINVPDERPSIIIVILDSLEHQALFAQAGINNTLLRPVNLHDPNEAIVFVEKLLSLRETAIANLRVERSSPLFLDHKPRVGTIARQIVGIWSPKGGVGKTTISLSLSIALAYYANAKTLLVDSDMNVGDIHSILDLDYNKNLYGLATTYASNQRLSLSDLETFLERYPQARIPLYILPGIVRQVLGGQPILTGKKGSELVAAIVNVLRNDSDFAFIIVDIGQKVSEGVHYEWLRSADLVLIVSTSENTTAREVYDAVETFRKDSIFADRIRSQRFKILFNRWDDRHGLDKTAFLKAVDLLEIATLPEDHSGDVTRMHNLGKSIVIEDPQHPFTQAIINLAAQLEPSIGAATAQVSRRSPAAATKVLTGTQPPKKRLFGFF